MVDDSLVSFRFTASIPIPTAHRRYPEMASSPPFEELFNFACHNLYSVLRPICVYRSLRPTPGPSREVCVCSAAFLCPAKHVFLRKSASDERVRSCGPGRICRRSLNSPAQSSIVLKSESCPSLFRVLWGLLLHPTLGPYLPCTCGLLTPLPLESNERFSRPAFSGSARFAGSPFPSRLARYRPKPQVRQTSRQGPVDQARASFPGAKCPHTLCFRGLLPAETGNSPKGIEWQKKHQGS